jgi:hypothetical protein
MYERYDIAYSVLLVADCWSVFASVWMMPERVGEIKISQAIFKIIKTPDSADLFIVHNHFILYYLKPTQFINRPENACSKSVTSFSWQCWMSFVPFCNGHGWHAARNALSTVNEPSVVITAYCITLNSSMSVIQMDTASPRIRCQTRVVSALYVVYKHV